jgi:hypothetical protein
MSPKSGQSLSGQDLPASRVAVTAILFLVSPLPCESPSGRGNGLLGTYTIAVAVCNAIIPSQVYALVPLGLAEPACISRRATLSPDGHIGLCGIGKAEGTQGEKAEGKCAEKHGGFSLRELKGTCGFCVERRGGETEETRSKRAILLKQRSLIYLLVHHPGRDQASQSLGL